MKILYTAIALTLFICACTKVEKQKNLYIRGRLFLYDTTTQNSVNIPLAKKRLLLAESNADSLNYLYADSTDSEGYFLFDLLNNDVTNFVIRYEEKINGYSYNAKQNVHNGDDNVQLVATLDTVKQNGFIIYAKDSLNGKLPGATIAIYNSPVLAQINDPAGALELLTASSTGRAFKLNLPEGIYYLNAKKEVTGFTLERIKKPITINKSGIVFIDSIQLKKK